MKKPTLLLSICLLLLCIGTVAKAQCLPPGTPVYTFFYGGQAYEVVQDNRSWTSAAACAVARGGQLAVIDSQQEQDSIFYWVNQVGINAANTVAPDGGNASYLWIGGNDFATEGSWIWDGQNTGTGPQFWQGTSSGSPVGGLYNNWGFEPDDFNGQDALGFAITNWPLGSAGQWNDIDRANSLYFIIEGANPVSAVTSPQFRASMTVYPNPGTGRFALTLVAEPEAQTEGKLEIYNTAGQLVKVLEVDQLEAQFDMDEFPNGMYFVRLSTGENTISSTKFILER